MQRHQDNDYFEPIERAIPEVVRRRRDLLWNVGEEARWCDDERILEENTEDVSPGGVLNKFGWWVIGTTIGGNALVVSETEDDTAIYFADHCGYAETTVSFPDYGRAAPSPWITLPLSADSVRSSLLQLAGSPEEYVARSTEMDVVLDKIG